VNWGKKDTHSRVLHFGGESKKTVAIGKGDLESSLKLIRCGKRKPTN